MFAVFVFYFALFGIWFYECRFLEAVPIAAAYALVTKNAADSVANP